MDREQEEIQLELKRIYDYLEPKIAPKDRAIVRWSFGLDPSRSWGAIECEGQEQLFV